MVLKVMKQIKFESSIKKLFKRSGPYTDFVDMFSSKYSFKYNMGLLHENEASICFTIFQVLSHLQVENKITVGLETSFTYESPTSNKKFDYRMDLVCCNEGAIMIIEMETEQNKDIY